jgi:hypothetical protein
MATIEDERAVALCATFDMLLDRIGKLEETMSAREESTRIKEAYGLPGSIFSDRLHGGDGSIIIHKGYATPIRNDGTLCYAVEFAYGKHWTRHGYMGSINLFKQDLPPHHQDILNHFQKAVGEERYKEILRRHGKNLNHPWSVRSSQCSLGNIYKPDGSYHESFGYAVVDIGVRHKFKFVRFFSDRTVIFEVEENTKYEDCIASVLKMAREVFAALHGSSEPFPHEVWLHLTQWIHVPLVCSAASENAIEFKKSFAMLRKSSIKEMHRTWGSMLEHAPHVVQIYMEEHSDDE